jgi:peroxiredoxin
LLGFRDDQHIVAKFAADFDQFAGKGVEILPISVDSTASLKEFRNKLQMKTERRDRPISFF